MTANVEQEALAQLGMRLAQCEIDRALLAARLSVAQTILMGVLDAVQWNHEDEEFDTIGAPAPRTASLPADVVMTLRGVVTSL